MTQTERLAHRWLRRQGYTATEIVYRGGSKTRQSPDFLTADGKGWEVKLARERMILFTTGQIAELRTHANVTVLIWRRAARGTNALRPVLRIPFHDLMAQHDGGGTFCGGFQIVIMDLARRKR